MNINVLNKRNLTNSRSVTPPPRKRNIPRDKSPIDLMATQKSQKTLKNTNLNNSNVNGSVIQPLENESESFKVYIRSRPISEKELNSVELGKEPNIIKKEDNMVTKTLLLRLPKFSESDFCFEHNQRERVETKRRKILCL